MTGCSILGTCVEEIRFVIQAKCAVGHWMLELLDKHDRPCIKLLQGTSVTMHLHQSAVHAPSHRRPHFTSVEFVQFFRGMSACVCVNALLVSVSAAVNRWKQDEEACPLAPSLFLTLLKPQLFLIQWFLSPFLFDTTSALSYCIAEALWICIIWKYV